MMNDIVTTALEYAEMLKTQSADDLFVLKPCPFCGGAARMETCMTAAEKKPRFRVRCSSCWCMTDWDNWSIEESAGKWNKMEGSNQNA